MKMRSLALCASAILFVLVSCKKDKSPTPPPNNDPEMLGAQSSKVFHYNFNGHLNDGSGNNLNATQSNNIAYGADRFGRANQAAIFGSQGNTTTVLTPSLAPQQVGFPFSVSFWFKANNVTESQTLIKSDGFERSMYAGFWAQLGITGAGTLSFNFGDGSGTNSSARNSLISPAIFNVDTWYHVVVNVRGADDMDLYVNGTRINNITYDGYATSVFYHIEPASAGLLGSYDSSSDSDFAGMMDDYRIYKKILSQTEVSALYNFAP